jgi:hypothetical protein
MLLLLLLLLLSVGVQERPQSLAGLLLLLVAAAALQGYLWQHKFNTSTCKEQSAMQHASVSAPVPPYTPH